MGFTVSAMVCIMASSPSCQTLSSTGSAGAGASEAGAALSSPDGGALSSAAGVPQAASRPNSIRAESSRASIFFIFHPPF